MKNPKSEGSDRREYLDDGEEREPRYVSHQQGETMEALSRGEITDFRISQKLAVDEIVSFGLKKEFLPAGLRQFPDPRKSWEVPIEVLLLPQILQRLNDEHSLVLAPYMLNSAALMSQLGFNARVLEQGFNERNVHERKTAFHGETLKHVLAAVDAGKLLHWFNSDLLPLWQGQAGKTRTGRYILDGTRLEVPAHLVGKYEGAGTVKNEDGTLSHGYKVVWLQEILEVPSDGGKGQRKGKTKENKARHRGLHVSLKIGPIEEHDLSLGKWVVSEFPFEKGDTLIFDRGFIDGRWVNALKKERGIDVYFPLRRDMKVSREVMLKSYSEGFEWDAHPTRREQWVKELEPKDLKLWQECPALQAGVLVKWKKRDGASQEVVFVTTKKNATPEKILAVYDQRAEIEESHRQLKCFQGLEVLPSKKWEHVVFRILMGMTAFNLLNLFLIQERCKDLSAFSLKTLRQKRVEERNPDVILFTPTTFAIMKYWALIQMLALEQNSLIRKNIGEVMARIGAEASQN